MKLTSKGKHVARTYLRKAGMCLATAALASMMATPLAYANSSGAGVVTGNGYGMNPSKEIGENTVPSAAKGDTAYVLTSLYNEKGQRYITGCCGGTGTASCDYLDVVGIDNVGSTGYNWGTKINISPDHFAWNDAVTDESTCTQVSGQADSASAGIGYVKNAWCGVMTYATVEKYTPDVLASTAPATYNKIVSMINDDGYTVVDKTVKYTATTSGDGPRATTTYTEDPNGTLVKVGSDYKELASLTFYAKGDSGYTQDNDGSYVMTNEKYATYAPKVVNLSASGNLCLTTLSDALWTEADAAESVDGYGETAVTRYGDPTDIAQDFEGFMKGLQWYILSKYEKSDSLKTVAYVSAYADGQVTCMATNPARTEDGSTAVRQYEGFEQIANNIALTGSTFTQQGTYTENGANTYVATTLSDFANVDVVFTASNFDATSLQAAFDAAGYTCKIVPVNVAIGNQGFGLARNLVEYMGYLYPNDVQLSYALKYFWSHFAHVKDAYIDGVMVDQDSTKLLPTGDAEIDLDTTGYSEYYILSRIAAGEEYYLANKDNADSNCNHYSLKAQGTVEANAYEYGVFAAKAKAAAPANTTPAKATAKAQTISGKAKVTKTYKAAKKTKKLAKAKTVQLKTAFKLSAKTALSYKKTSGNKKITVTNAGKVTVKKGLKKGTYKVKVKVTAKATTAYKAATKTITLTVKVK